MLLDIRRSLLVCLMIAINATIVSGVARAQDSTAKLVDDLTLIGSQAPGIDSAAMFGGFIGEDAPAKFEMGVLGVPPPKVPPQMRELVRRGMSALPTLIAHLDDARPTKLMVGNGPANVHGTVGVDRFMFTIFGSEYDPRVRPSSPGRGQKFVERDFNGRYTVKVGDVCYSLIGQIVNRRLIAVRYQPSAGLVVNSPIETPALIEQVKKDWGTADSETLKASLLSDIQIGKELYSYESAFTRLRFYYPETYNALQGEDLKKRLKFEAEKARTTRSR